MLGMGSSYIPGGDATVMAAQSFIGNPVTSDPVRHARTVAILEARPSLGLGAPTVGWAAAAFDAMGQFRRAALHRESAPADGAGRGRARRDRLDAWRPRNSGCGCAPARI